MTTTRGRHYVYTLTTGRTWMNETPTHTRTRTRTHMHTHTHTRTHTTNKQTNKQTNKHTHTHTHTHNKHKHTKTTTRTHKHTHTHTHAHVHTKYIHLQTGGSVSRWCFHSPPTWLLSAMCPRCPSYTPLPSPPHRVPHLCLCPPAGDPTHPPLLSFRLMTTSGYGPYPIPLHAITLSPLRMCVCVCVCVSVCECVSVCVLCWWLSITLGPSATPCRLSVLTVPRLTWLSETWFPGTMGPAVNYKETRTRRPRPAISGAYRKHHSTAVR